MSSDTFSVWSAPRASMAVARASRPLDQELETGVALVLALGLGAQAIGRLGDHSVRPPSVRPARPTTFSSEVASDSLTVRARSVGGLGRCGEEGGAGVVVGAELVADCSELLHVRRELLGAERLRCGHLLGGVDEDASTACSPFP